MLKSKKKLTGCLLAATAAAAAALIPAEFGYMLRSLPLLWLLFKSWFFSSSLKWCVIHNAFIFSTVFTLYYYMLCYVINMCLCINDKQ